MADIIAWPLGKLAVNTSMPCGTRSGRGRMVEQLEHRRGDLAAADRREHEDRDPPAPGHREVRRTTAAVTKTIVKTLPSPVMSRMVSSSQRGPIGSERSSGIAQGEQDLAVEGRGRAFADLVGQREEAVAEQAHGQQRDEWPDLVEAQAAP